MYNQTPQPGPTPTIRDPSPQDQGLSPGVEHSTLPQGNFKVWFKLKFMPKFDPKLYLVLSTDPYLREISN